MKTIYWKELTTREKKQALLRPALGHQAELTAQVERTLNEVKSHGDLALRELTERYDRVRLERFEVTAQEFQKAHSLVTPVMRAALLRAATNIETFHQKKKPTAFECDVEPGVRCERVPRAIRSVGLYAPGGSAPLPSTVLMLGIPSRIAGCALRILCTPPQPDGSVDPTILEAASLCGIDRVYKIGGAQAIAALAFGTDSIPKVDKIFGPGNSWVTEAKRQVAESALGAAIDMPAGPSEVLVIADKLANPIFIAADLLSQAEHGPDSQVVLVTDTPELVTQVEGELQSQLLGLSRAQIARVALANSLVVLVDSIEEALNVSNAYAPEHLILQVEDPCQWKEHIQNAGSVFLGAWSPESAGDYASGTNHVLPTYGHARALSGLCVDSFMKQITFQELTPSGLQSLGPVIETLAEMEGLSAHRSAVTLRLRALAQREETSP